MTDKELFLNEIKTVKLIIQANRAQGAFTEGYLIGQESVLEHFEKFVDSMQEEQDDVDNLIKCQNNSIKVLNETLYNIERNNRATKEHVDYDKLDTILDESLSKETKESWNERLGEEKPKFKVGDIIRKINDGLEAKVTSVDNSGFIYAACEDWEQIIYPKDWELVEEPAKKDFRERYKRIAESDAFKKAYEGSIGEVIHIEDEEPVSEDLEKAAKNVGQKYFPNEYNIWARPNYEAVKAECAFKDGVNWQKEHLWKPADGDDLPEYDREVVVLIKYNVQPNIHDKEYPTYRVGFGHRPNPNGWDGRNIDTNDVTHYTPKLYDKGGWNAPNIVYWLDVELPKE